MLGGTTFPPIAKAPYFLSLGPHGFYWFRLERERDGEGPYGIEGTPI
jgi:maltose alpha-D-glucosyltransferase/alpha-amylase